MKSGIQRLFNAKQLLRAMGSQSASVYANQVIAFVVPWLVLTKTGSAASAGLVAFAMAAASFVGTLIGGPITDRIGGRKVSIIADTLSLLTTVTLAATLFFDYFALWLVIVTQILGVFFDGPGQIAKNTTIPAAAANAKVPVVRAMGLVQTLQNVAMFVGPISAGVLISWLSESMVLGLASAIFLVAIYLMARLPRKIVTHEHPLTFSQAYRDTKEAAMFIIKEPFLGPMQIFGPCYAFVVGPIATIIFPALYVLAHRSSAELGTFLGAVAIGGTVGGLIFATFAPKVSQRKWLAAATIYYGLGLYILSLLSPGSLSSVIIGFLAGVGFTGLMAIPYTAFYTRTPERLLGRVNSLGWAIGSLVIALGSLFFGWFIQLTSPATALIVCAFILLAMGVGVMLLPFMRHLDETPAPGAEMPDKKVKESL